MFGANIIKKQQEIAAMTAADALTKIDEAEAKLAKLKAAAYRDEYAIMDAHESIMHWHEIHAAKAREEEEAADQADQAEEATSETTEEEAREDRARERAAEKVAKVLPADADHDPLVEWALAWHKAVTADWKHPVDGVIVGEDGTILGETWNQDGTYRVVASTRQRYGLRKNVLDMCIVHISRQAVQEAIHVKSWEVAPSRPRPTALDLLRDARSRQPSDEYINELMAEARRDGTPISAIADAAGIKSRNTVYLRTDPLMEKDNEEYFY